MAKIQKIKGFSDLFPPDSDAFTFMEEAARRVFGRYGFGELRTPVLEKTELFARSIGEDTDVVGKEMFTFPDRKGRSLTLRPEATAGVVRAFVEKADWQPGKVSKLYTIGPMFRYERPQAGRQRQFHQINAEIFGADEPQADAELLLMLRAFLNELGLTRLSVELNSLGCPDCRPAYNAELKDFLAALPEEELCEDCRRRRTANPLRVLDCKVPRCKELSAAAPAVSDRLCPECRDHFADVRAVLDAAAFPYTLNPRLVRGLDYYQRTTFEVVSGEIGAQSAVAGGGRYDGLIRTLGGPEVSGTGFACGMERLAMLLPKRPEAAPDFYLLVADPRAVNAALLLAQALRDRGMRGVADFSARSMKSGLRQADRLGAKKCYILGGGEFESRTVSVKDMAGEAPQITLSWDLLLDGMTDPQYFPK